MKDEFDYKFELLLNEINILQSGIRNYDSILLIIKGWAITSLSGFVFFALREKRLIYLLICTFVIILFWVFDSINKSFQRRYIVRYNKVEHFLRSNKFSKSVENRSFKNFNIPDVGARVSVKNKPELTSPLKAAFILHNSILYLSMLFLLGIITIWNFFFLQ